MKKVILGMILGIFLQKAAYTAYSYYWWTAGESKECVDKITGNGLGPNFDCIYQKMGYIRYLSYFLLNLDYSWEKWNFRF